MLHNYLTPVNLQYISNNTNYSVRQWHKHLQIYINKEELPDITNIQLAIVAVSHQGNYESLSPIRKHLYSLYNWQQQLSIADLGNVKVADSRSDTYFNLRMALIYLLRNNIIPIIIGTDHDATYGQFAAHTHIEPLVDVVVFDQHIDLQGYHDIENSTDNELLQNQSFLYKLLTQKPNLFNFTHIGYQQYLVDSAMVDTLEALHFDCYSLGQIRESLREIEPLTRQAQMISFDLAAIRSSDAPGVSQQSPSGFTGEEACRIARYAGLSDYVSSFGIYDYNSQTDPHQQTAMLIAQMIWYFAFGVENRKNDIPKLNSSQYLKYIVHLKETDYELSFIKSKRTDRWWIQFKLPDNINGIPTYRYIPCSYADYQTALKDDIPERYLKTMLRMG